MPGRVVKTGFHGAHRDTDDVGDLGQRHADVVMQDEDSAVLGAEGSEGALQGVAVLDGLAVVGFGRPFDGQDVDPRPPSAPAS